MAVEISVRGLQEGVVCLLDIETEQFCSSNDLAVLLLLGCFDGCLFVFVRYDSWRRKACLESKKVFYHNEDTLR